jgi:DNA-binding response OmpR family regulator
VPTADRKILIVEDDEFMLRALERYCANYGQSVVSTTLKDAEKAIEQDLAAIILDIGLPDGSGLTLLETLREKGRDTPVLVLTGLDPVDIAERVRELRAELLLKSDDSSKLKEFLRRALASSGVATNSEDIP